MGNNFTNLTVANPVVQSAAATADNHLVRLADARQLLAGVLAGAYNSGTTYAAGVLVTTVAGIWSSLQAANLNHAPASNPSWWSLVLAATPGDDSFVYIGYATDASGTGFSLTADVSRPYIAFKVSAVAIPSPVAGDFSGWVKFIGAAGADGDDGDAGDDGASVYGYVAYASNSSGAGFSLTPSGSLGYVAFKFSASVIPSPAAGDFAGLWVAFKGAKGDDGDAGDDGNDGDNAYLYVAFASDNIGTGFSLTPGSGLNFIAVKHATTVIGSPSAGDFTGLWKLYASPPPVAGGVMKSDGSGNIVGGATTDDLTEGADNFYLTPARVLATVLAGLDAGLTGDVADGDQLIAALSKLQNRIALSTVNQHEGTIVIANGEDTNTLDGLTLGFTPTRVQLTVQVPVAGLFITAVLLGVPTVDGFTWVLSAPVDSGNYRLHYRIT